MSLLALTPLRGLLPRFLQGSEGPKAHRSRVGRGFGLGAALVALVLPGLAMAQDDPRAGWPEPVHAISLYGDVKYPPGFTHFDYVNPEAPKGGDLRYFGFGSFDTLNPFTVKGVTAAGAGQLYQTLTVQSLDEPFTEYGSIAESMVLPEDRTWIAFNINPKARWSDGQPITAQDVKFTFETLITEGAPIYRLYYQAITEAKVIDDSTIQFLFENGDNRELPLIIGGLPVLAKHYWEGREFGDTTLETPVSSGPYRIKDFEPGRYISYERDPDWWAADLPVNLGRFNFDELRYDYYRDHLVAVEAFKAGEYDYRSEHISKVWATDYQIPEVDDGRIVKAEIPHQRPVGMQGFVFNMRKPLFQDPKVREALAYAFDFTWTNKNIFYDSYKQPYSYFNNSVMASTGLPEGEELALLEPWRDQIPERVFTEEYKAPLYTEPRDLRGGLRTALMLLQEAGWTVQDGVLKNEAGEPFEFEFLLIQPEFDRILLPMSKNLERLGIKMSIRPVDTSQYVNRLNEQDFDMIVFSWAQTESPGNEQREMWGSAAADQAGSRNLAGLKNPAVDALIEEIVTAPTREDLNLRVRAMDRILLWSFLVIPQSYVDSDRLIHWDRFGKPEVTPYKGVSIMTWWEDPDKAARLPGKQGDR